MLFYFAVIITYYLVVVTEQARLSIVNEFKFPHPLDTIFKLQIVPVNPLDKLDRFYTNTMILRITDGKGIQKEKHVFDYGQKDKTDDKIKSEFITIEEWTKNRDPSSIQLSMSFNRISNGHIIQIFDLQAPSPEIRKTMMDNLGLTNPLYNETVQLVSPSKVQLTINTICGDYIVLRIGQLNVAKCRSYDGIPVETVNFTNLQNHNVINRTFVNENNEISVTFRVKLSDHLRRLNCSAGRFQTSMVIRVLHPTTVIIIDPSVSKTLEVNSTISCYPSNGYPPAHTQWSFINGPTNAPSFYELKNKGKDLQIKADAPTETFWRFNCSAKGDRRIIKTISFITKDKYCDIFCLNGKIKAQNFRLLMINDQINKSMEILKETSKKYLKIFQESIGNITKNFDSIGQRNKQEIDEIKTSLKYGIVDLPDLDWTIDGVSDKNIRHVHLNKQFFPGLPKTNAINFNVYFYPDKLRMYLMSSSYHLFQSYYPIKLQTTIAVINQANPQYNIIVTKSFVLERVFSMSPHFILTKEELTKVFQNDYITIKCFIKFIK